MAACVFLCVVLLHLSGVLPASALECGGGSQPCRDGSDCVHTQHVCDGERDCVDGSDEENCQTCSEGQFQCVQGRRCIQRAQVCDGEPHCQDGSDEAGCPSDTCFHRCSIGSRCLPASMLCDGEADCPEGSDEEGCGGQDLGEGPAAPSAPPAAPSAPPAAPSAPPAAPSAPPAAPSAPPAAPSAPPPAPVAPPAAPPAPVAPPAAPPAPVAPPSEPVKCPLHLVRCRNGVQCVPHDHVCDGQADCADGSDEDECASSCGPDQFQCAHGRKCISQTEVCDGEPHCQDRSDEADCYEKGDGCSHHCDKGSRCIPESFLCDGERDCLDGSDEALCEDKRCGATDFQCSSGECVKASMHCDGHPDCSDRSDEEGCSNPVACPTKLRCERSKECLLPEWLCDGQLDCMDGSDEKNCSVARLDCADFQWSCKSRTQCLSASWRCDGFIDCEDVSDEVNCGRQPCAPHLVRCGSQECVDVSLMCNGVRNCVDGSDEGAGCTPGCSEADLARCSQTCYSTPQGPRCACAAGFHLKEDGATCEDVDECASATVCGQLCVNSEGSYHCACQQGYTMEPGGRHCKVSGDPYLLTSVQTDLLLLELRSKALEELLSSAQKAILSVDYDWKEQKVYWVTVDADSIEWSSLDQKTTGTLIRGVRADSVAVDWLGRNLYWIDGERSQIVAISLSTSSNYSIILDEDLDQPRSLALMPQKGLLFWTEIGNVVKIERAGMDGSDRQVVVNSSLGWPGAVTVDTVSNRIYWTDERLKAIGSATLDGNELQILQIKETANPFSLAVFNENLFWSDAKRRVVLSAHKASGKNPQVLLKRLRQPFAVKIIHPVLQTGPEELCQQKACSHMCVLAPGPVAVCRCPAGLLLADDGLSCSTQGDSAFLLMLSSSTVTKISLQSRHSAAELKGWPEHLVLQVPGIDDAAMIDYSVQNHTLFLTDDGRSSLSSFSLKDSDLVPQGRIFRLQDDTISAVALDWVTYNVYWSSKKQPGLQVTSITAVHTAVLLKVGLKRLESLALHPPTGSLCFSNLDQQGSGTVECSSMDGSERRVVWKDVVHATSLVFSGDGGTVYWADTGLGSIGSVQVDGSGFREVKVEGVSAVALSDDTLLWMTVGEKRQLWFRDEPQQSRLWFQVDSQVVALKAFSRFTQSGSSQCAEDNGGCQQLCLATPQGRSCRCAHDHVPLNATHCQPEQRCPEGSRSCLDQLSCQPANKFCDGHVDCPDHSDENCVRVKTPSGAPAPPPATAAAPSPTTQTQVSGLNATLEISSELDALDSAECSRRRCSGHGRCTEGGCACSSPYTGDSCEKRLLKLQGPVMYGAVAVCAGVLLLIVVVLVVVLKKRTANRGSSPAAATTVPSMMMQDRAETKEGKCPSSVVGGEVEVLAPLNTTTS